MGKKKIRKVDSDHSRLVNNTINDQERKAELQYRKDTQDMKQANVRGRGCPVLRQHKNPLCMEVCGLSCFNL